MRVRFLVVLLVASSCAQAAAPAPVLTDRVRMFDDPAKPEKEWGYDPKEIRVPSGTLVRFRNDGVLFHTVTSDDAQRTFDIAAYAGDSISIRFDRAGTFRYHCGVHPDMKGVVHVCDGACQ